MNLRSIEGKVADGKALSSQEKALLNQKATEYWDEHPDVTSRFPRWRKHMAWVAGHQRTDFSNATKKLVTLARGNSRKLIFNRMRPFVKTLLGKLSADVPKPGVIPNTSEDADIESARVGDKVLDALTIKLHYKALLLAINLWIIITNRVGIRVFWNEEDHGIVSYEEEEVKDPDTNEVLRTKWEPIPEPGDIGIEILSPFQFRTDPLFSNPKKWRWVVFGEEVDQEALEEEYGLEEGELTATDSSLDTAYDLEATSDSIAMSVPEDKESIKGKTVVRMEFWTPKMMAVMAGKRVLETKPNKNSRIPLFVIEDRLIPVSNYEKGIVYNEAVIKDAIPVQREYNRHKSIISLALERASKLKILLPLGSVMNRKSFTNEFGTFIDCNTKLGEPHQMKLDSLPPFMPQYTQDLEKEFQNIMSIHPASVGQLPERASHASGTLLNLLLEQDDAVLSPLLQVRDEVLNDVWSFVLELVQENYTVGRLLKHTGINGVHSVGKFKGSDLRGNTDVRVVSQTGLPRSRALRIEYVMKLREAKLLTDDKLCLEMLEFGNAERIFEDSILHERRAHRENGKIEEDKEINPEITPTWIYPFEDHLAHLPIHVKDRLSPKYDLYSESQRQALEKHIQATMQIVATQAQQQAQGQVEPPPPESTPQEAQS